MWLLSSSECISGCGRGEFYYVLFSWLLHTTFCRPQHNILETNWGLWCKKKEWKGYYSLQVKIDSPHALRLTVVNGIYDCDGKVVSILFSELCDSPGIWISRWHVLEYPPFLSTVEYSHVNQLESRVFIFRNNRAFVFLRHLPNHWLVDVCRGVNVATDVNSTSDKRVSTPRLCFQR